MKYSVLRGTKIILKKEFENLNKVGETYEVGNVTDSMVVVRKINDKVAVGAVTYEDFDNYFDVKTPHNKFTGWETFADGFGNVIGSYRTNQKKVQVKLLTSNIEKPEIKAESSCNNGDVFNLYFGLRLAYLRAIKKMTDDKIQDSNKKYRDLAQMSCSITKQIQDMLISIDKNTKTFVFEIKREDENV